MGDRFRVVVTDFLHDALVPERTLLNEIADVEALEATAEQQLVGRVESADAIILYHEIAMTRLSLARLEKCRLIVRGGVGFDNVDGPLARSLGIPVANVPDYGSEEVADSALAMALTLMRGSHYLNGRLQALSEKWAPQVAAPLFRVRGSTFGIVGLGRIGTATALRARAFGLDVCFYDPYKPDGYDKAVGIRRCESLEQLLSTSRVVSLHCPLTDETRHLMREETVAWMPRGSYLINTARGDVVQTAAVARAVESGQLAGAGIDVLPHEPPRPDDPLVNAWRDPAHEAHWRVIITPHAAFYSEEGMQDLRRKTAEACRRALLGLPLRNLVN